MRAIFSFAVSLMLVLGAPGARAQSAESAAADALPLVTGQATVLPVIDRWRQDPLAVFSGADVDLEEFRWIARPVVVFANSEDDPAFQDQLRLLLARPDALRDRDVVLITDTDPAARSDIRLKLRPRGFMLALVGKDGEVKLRKPLPWDVRELTRVIDKIPMRQREMNEEALGN